jgi:predicted nucleic acid-binding protein
MLILADTSIWIDHLRKGNSLFKDFLEEGVVLMHPCVLGELALGNLKNRAEILRFLEALPESEAATDNEVFHVINTKELWGRGIGWIDAHLLASSMLTSACVLWTLDTSLRDSAAKAGAKLFHGAGLGTV